MLSHKCRILQNLYLYVIRVKFGVSRGVLDRHLKAKDNGTEVKKGRPSLLSREEVQQARDGVTLHDTSQFLEH